MAEFVRIMVFEHEFEAQVTKAALEEHGIPHQIWTFHDTAYDGLFQFTSGWGFLLAPEEYREQISELHGRLSHG